MSIRFGDGRKGRSKDGYKKRVCRLQFDEPKTDFVGFVKNQKSKKRTTDFTEELRRSRGLVKECRGGG